MSLEKYNQKRNFKETDEPKGKIKKSESELVFVVQKHAASHLHYDFRLEMEGVLKSWAVPKGPSLDPQVKRLAMLVEDHPYDYKDFEGAIPEGNYGAGNVIVWDNGTYLPATTSGESPEKKLLSDLQKGRLSFIMKGKKLKGEFSLVKLKGKQENAWLLIKKEDKYATEKDILLKNKSVITKVTLESLEPKAAKAASIKAKKESEKVPNIVVFQKPMLAETLEHPFDNAEWIFENKFDGYRTVSVINENKVELFSRNHLSFTSKFSAIADELKKIDHNAVLDGEVVVENKSGQSDFQMLQNYIKSAHGTLKYYVFDILNLDGNDTTQLPLLKRKELLKLLLQSQKLSHIHYSEHIEEKGIDFFKLAEKNQAEGMIAKKSDSKYSIGARSSHWVKIKLTQQEEAVIIGITEPKNSRHYFGALLLGQYDGTEIKFIGKCGTGFTETNLKEFYNQFKVVFTDIPPLSEKVNLRDTIQWMKPKFVAQIKYSEWTQDMHLRHPVFLGLRIDKKPREVTVPKLVNIQLEKMEKTENNYLLKLGSTTLQLTNQNKIYFPEDNITKGDIISYYTAVAEYILPYLKNRPQSMNRFPNGIHGQSFYQKDVDLDKVPSWIKTAKIDSDSEKSKIDYLICNDKQTLLYMANLGCIDINPWNSTIKKLDNPDWIVIDIDPEKEDFKEVVETALVIKQVMDELETDCYCKTSGATGLHVYIPLGAKYTYETVKIFAEIIAKEIQHRLPEITTLERSIKKRNHKIYLDYLQNRKGQTLAAPYSVRPKLGATVSTPLEWQEVTMKLHPSQFTIKNVLQRFEKKGDLWKPVLGKGADIKKMITKLEDK